MVRLFKYLLVTLVFATVTLSTNHVYAQSTEATSTPTPPQTSTTSPTGTPAVSAPTPTITATVAITTPDAITPGASTAVTQGSVLLPTPSPVPTTTDTTTGTTTVTAPLTQTVQPTTVQTDEESVPLEGTIIANRSETVVRFFLEGATYELEVGRSQGVELPRASTVLNLFNCPADLPDDTEGCFWDPYLIQQDGFYEIYEATGNTAQTRLMLREAGAPPTGQVWVQNRTGQTESLVYKDEVYELPPTTVLEFPVSTGVPTILYVRNCLTVDNQSACEWAPKTLDAGVYYAMVEVDTPGTDTGSTQTTIDLRPVVGAGEEDDEVEAVNTPGILCSVVVPALNVRSGPGLQYDIIGKVRADGETATVNVTGRSADSEWLTVEPSVAQDGWINNSPSFITCTGDVASLPVVEAPPPPTPQPIVEQPPVVSTEDVTSTETDVASPDAATPEDATQETPAQENAQEQTVPPGQGLLIVNNGFQHEMRFTIDQTFRPQEGPSEYDIPPGGSVSIVVYPGDVAFSASTPWSGLSSNATIRVEPDQALPLWIRFEPDVDGGWVFRWN